MYTHASTDVLRFTLFERDFFLFFARPRGREVNCFDKAATTVGVWVFQGPSTETPSRFAKKGGGR